MKKNKKRKIPKSLQGVLWSTDVALLDAEKDKGYIIHQIFSYGTWDDILWVFKNYPIKEITQVFTTRPFKDYFAARFYFIKNYLLNLKNYKMNERRYVKNTPRDLGQRETKNF